MRNYKVYLAYDIGAGICTDTLPVRASSTEEAELGIIELYESNIKDVIILHCVAEEERR